MPQAATLPTSPLAHSHSRRSSRAAPRHVPLEERVAVLEMHAQSIATVADVRASENRMTLWIFGAALALAGFCFAILSASEARMDKRIDALDMALDKRMDALDSRIDKLDSRIDKLDSRIDTAVAELKADIHANTARMGRLEERMDRFDAKLDSRFDALMSELRSQRRGE